MPKVKQDSLQDNGRRAISVEGSEKKQPKLTNRGGSGLYGKFKGRLVFKTESTETNSRVAKYRIPPDLQAFAVPINSLIPDPQNANEHPERSIDAIRKSLKRYGQQKVIVAREHSRVVIAGNGTLEAAKSLGWQEIACRFTDLDDVDSIGYGIDDNKTAELARWNFECLKRLNELQVKEGQELIGWTQKELDLLRAIDWVPPEESEDQSSGLGTKYHVVVECESEQEQLELLKQLTAEGHTCRALVS